MQTDAEYEYIWFYESGQNEKIQLLKVEFNWEIKFQIFNSNWKRYDFSKVSLILCMLPSQVALF